MPYANDYGPTFHIFDYIRKLTPPKTHEESNLMANELSDIRIRIEDEVYSHRIDFRNFQRKVSMLNIYVIKALKLKSSHIPMSQMGKRRW